MTLLSETVTPPSTLDRAPLCSSLPEVVIDESAALPSDVRL